jgi:hypothetical protein
MRNSLQTLTMQKTYRTIFDTLISISKTSDNKFSIRAVLGQIQQDEPTAEVEAVGGALVPLANQQVEPRN